MRIARVLGVFTVLGLGACGQTVTSHDAGSQQSAINGETDASHTHASALGSGGASSNDDTPLSHGNGGGGAGAAGKSNRPSDNRAGEPAENSAGMSGGGQAGHKAHSGGGGTGDNGHAGTNAGNAGTNADAGGASTAGAGGASTAGAGGASTAGAGGASTAGAGGSSGAGPNPGQHCSAAEARICRGDDVLRCTHDATTAGDVWTLIATCDPGTCNDGWCPCQDGDRRCSAPYGYALGPALGPPQLCVNGVWQDDGRCDPLQEVAPGTRLNFMCSEGRCVCSGNEVCVQHCAPTLSCDHIPDIYTCGADGVWKVTANCPSICNPQGSPWCDGACRGEGLCKDGMIQRCAYAEHGYLKLPEPCPASKPLCAADGMSCVCDPAAPSECISSNEVLACRDGDWRSDLCDYGCANGACNPAPMSMP